MYSMKYTASLTSAMGVLKKWLEKKKINQFKTSGKFNKMATVSFHGFPVQKTVKKKESFSRAIFVIIFDMEGVIIKNWSKLNLHNYKQIQENLQIRGPKKDVVVGSSRKWFNL